MCLQGAEQVIENIRSFKLSISTLVIKTHFHLSDLFVHFTPPEHHAEPWKCWNRSGRISPQVRTMGEGQDERVQWLFVLLVKQREEQ